jgi:hypothetical protein
MEKFIVEVELIFTEKYYVEAPSHKDAGKRIQDLIDAGQGHKIDEHKIYSWVKSEHVCMITDVETDQHVIEEAEDYLQDRAPHMLMEYK